MLSDIVHLSDLRQPRAKVSTQWAPEDCPLWEPVVFIAEVAACESSKRLMDAVAHRQVLASARGDPPRARRCPRGQCFSSMSA
jgi:hypothetical protein